MTVEIDTDIEAGRELLTDVAPRGLEHFRPTLVGDDTGDLKGGLMDPDVSIVKPSHGR